MKAQIRQDRSNNARGVMRRLRAPKKSLAHRARVLLQSFVVAGLLLSVFLPAISTVPGAIGTYAAGLVPTALAATEDIYVDGINGAAWYDFSYEDAGTGNPVLADVADPLGGGSTVKRVTFNQPFVYGGYGAGNYVGPIAIGTYTTLQFDVYSPTITSLEVWLVNAGTEGPHETVTVTSGWTTVQVGIAADLAGSLSQYDQVQFRPFNTGSTMNLYLDNIELNDTPVGPPPPPPAAPGTTPAYYYDHETAYVINNSIDTTNGGMVLALDPATNLPYGSIGDAVFGLAPGLMVGTDKSTVGQAACIRYFITEYQRITTSGEGLTGINEVLVNQLSASPVANATDLLTVYAASCADFVIDHLVIPASGTGASGVTCPAGAICPLGADQDDTDVPNLHYYWGFSNVDGTAKFIDESDADTLQSAVRSESVVAWSLAELALMMTDAGVGTPATYTNAALDYWEWRENSAIAVADNFDGQNTSIPGVARDVFYPALGFTLAEVTGDSSYRDGGTGTAACTNVYNADGKDLCGAVPYLNQWLGAGPNTGFAPWPTTTDPDRAIQDGAYVSGYGRGIAFAKHDQQGLGALTDRDQWWDFGFFTALDDTAGYAVRTDPTSLNNLNGTNNFAVPFAHFGGRELLAGTLRSEWFFYTFGVNPDNFYSAGQTEAQFATATQNYWNYINNNLWDDTSGQRSWYESTALSYKPCFSAGTEVPMADWKVPAISGKTHTTASTPANEFEDVTFDVTVNDVSETWEFLNWEFKGSGVNKVELLWTCDAGVASSGDETLFSVLDLTGTEPNYSGTLDGADVDAVCDTGDKLYYYTRVTDNFGNTAAFSEPANVGAAIDPEAKLTAEDWWYGATVSLTADPGDFQFVQFGEAPTVSLGSYIWQDVDGDGIQDGGEPAIQGATVVLLNADGTPALDADGAPVGSQTTGTNGHYYFDNLAEGTYKVQVTAPGYGYMAAVQDLNANNNEENDSNIAQQTAPDVFLSASITLTAGDEPSENTLAGDNQDSAAETDGNMTLDMGLVLPVSVGSLVWDDLDGDGTQDAGEPGIPGATVRLLDADGNPVLDIDGNAVAPVTTGADGAYSFINLLPGDYMVEVTPPAGYRATTTPADADPDTNALNNDSNGLPTGSGETVMSPVFTLTQNGEPTSETDAGGSDQDGQTDSYGNMTVDFGFVQPAAIGNYVWVDENSDGYQDAGEPGIANVTVNLLDAGNNLVATTVTDAAGGYLFPDLAPGVYTVQVDETTLPAGMSQTPTSTTDSDGDGRADDGDLGNKPNNYTVSVVSGEENLTADFGYNYNPTGDVNNGLGTAALGDRIWVDSDGDGVQDPNEIGVAGVQVSLLTDDNNDGIFGGSGDNPATTTTTDENGNYLFDNLSPGAYVVAVTDSGTASHDVLDLGTYAQTGDPDHFGTNSIGLLPGGAAGDHKTTIPVVLAPGDVFLNADFGYSPSGASLGSIGDTIFFDADMDGNGLSLAPVDGGSALTQGAGGAADASDYGIAGVTVALIQDSNGNGVWDAGEPVIATDTTDANGQYLFEGLPLTNAGDGDAADSDYLVWVNDTNNVLAGLNQSYDSDGVLGSPDISAITINAGTPDDRAQDFGYGASQPVGTIGDTIWYDVNNSGDDQSNQGTEPGIPGITVNLYQDNDGDGTPDDLDGDGNTSNDPDDVVATTVTDADGTYLFSNLPLDSYIVAVDTAGIGSAGFGTTPTFDADGGADSRSQVSLTTTNPVNLNQDFSYTKSGLNSVGDYVWGDVNSSGGATAQAGEPGLAGVTVKLTPPAGVDAGNGAGQPVYTTTDADGFYLFTDLPDGSYTVEVVTDTLPQGWSAASTYDGPDGGSDSSSTVALSGGTHDRAQDFSYPPSATPLGVIGDTVWFDANSNHDGPGDEGDGSSAGADNSESGLEGVLVKLYQDVNANGTFEPGTDTLLASTYTDGNGNYLFTGLALNDGGGDSDFDYLVVVDTATLPSSVSPASTYEDDAATGGDSISPVSLSAASIATGSHVNLDQDFGYPPLTSPGLIGDTIWFDNGQGGGTARDGIQNGDEPGVEGVVVELLDSNGSLIAIATTDENGHYLFGGLDPLATYTVRVASSNFAAGGVLEGTENTGRPLGSTVDGSNQAAASQVDLGAAGADDSEANDPDGVDNGINLGQDFGYAAPVAASGSIGNLVWLDQNADGLNNGVDGPDGVANTDDDEPGIAGVTVDLYRDLNGNGVVDPGEPLMGTAVTDANGAYLFSNLPIVGNGDADAAAEYVVDVTDEAGILNGYWHSLAADQNVNSGVSGDTANDSVDRSKSDPVAVAIDATVPNNLNVDFGYFVEPAAIGNYVWNDENRDGIQDAGEPAIDGVKVTLTINYPGGTSTTISTITGDNPATVAVERGWYNFGNLLLDEDHNGDGAGSEPTYVITMDTNQAALTAMTPTLVNAGGDDSKDADDPVNGVTADATQGQTDTVQQNDPTTEPVQAYNDFGVYCDSDWGDLPGDQNYPVTKENDGGRHCIVPGLNLGSTVTMESDGQPAADANGDVDDGVDVNGAFWSFGAKTFTMPVDVVNTTGRDAQVVGWIDFNMDGDVNDPNERSLPALADASLPGPGAGDTTFTTGNVPAGFSGTVTLQWANVDLPQSAVISLFTRVRLTYDATFFSDSSPEPYAWVNSGEVEDNVKPFNTLPVTVSYVHAQRQGGDVRFAWQTATETSSAGFNILVETPQGIVQLNPALVPSKVIDSLAPTDYDVTLATNAVVFYLEEVGIDGAVDRMGPYEVGKTYGSIILPDRIDPGDSVNRVFLPAVRSR